MNITNHVNRRAIADEQQAPPQHAIKAPKQREQQHTSTSKTTASLHHRRRPSHHHGLDIAPASASLTMHQQHHHDDQVNSPMNQGAATTPFATMRGPSSQGRRVCRTFGCGGVASTRPDNASLRHHHTNKVCAAPTTRQPPNGNNNKASNSNITANHSNTDLIPIGDRPHQRQQPSAEHHQSLSNTSGRATHPAILINSKQNKLAMTSIGISIMGIQHHSVEMEILTSLI